MALQSYDLFGVWSWVNYLFLGSYFFSLVCTTSKIIFSSASDSPLGGTSRNNPARSRLQTLSQYFPLEVTLLLGSWWGTLVEPPTIAAGKEDQSGGWVQLWDQYFLYIGKYLQEDHELPADYFIQRVRYFLPFHLLSTRWSKQD